MEAAFTIVTLIVIFFCVFNFALMASSKLHSLQDVSEAARAQQLNRPMPFGTAAYTRTLPTVGVIEVVLPFHAAGTITLPGLWTSRMRTVLPRRAFLAVSWPGARSES